MANPRVSAELADGSVLHSFFWIDWMPVKLELRDLVAAAELAIKPRTR